MEIQNLTENIQIKVTNPKLKFKVQIHVFSQIGLSNYPQSPTNPNPLPLKFKVTKIEDYLHH